jgi:hypothetical protein
VADIIPGAGPGGGPHVKVFDAATGATLQSGFVYDKSFTGGVYVASGDFNGDGKDDIFTAPGKNGGPNVIVFDGATPGKQLANFFAYDKAFNGGVRVAVKDLTADGIGEIVTAQGPGGNGLLQVLNPVSKEQAFPALFAYDAEYTGGVFAG